MEPHAQKIFSKIVENFTISEIYISLLCVQRDYHTKKDNPPISYCLQELSILLVSVLFVSELGKKIKEKVKELKNDICSDIDDGDLDLQLWKVNIFNSDVDKFSSLRLQEDESKGIEKLEGTNLISKYWGDLEEGFTHVIVTSNYLINQNLREKIKELTENFENVSIQFESE
ncbi:hypothetical protein GLOIN_2v1649929 [Rhizophagus irregularis DAOM 181602=DAOM 197198]|uniref:Crinkler effector protein N-terminal domain-containing protein n=1 Tax=Rhizophagus irregularis (strain DAOM 181602 / DAOM 197198 / MUCL 43194) TaxID=747089 RepID=A0A2P4PPE2_RHIID|nr:hypothetical protein GLOIN_2v1649929 [Rhizophagus irregularis DAOM 181602=DAOM 197198]POG67242.1 hypothetical protein GLOIN_2v1649929 [Rhizophagus irregularis DAOM 181602=DAOM 197198]|eukprot:XP_025174108.1 hypothetical protein GLOIN_2v1649929 [Rhizophagus irregularis DAOM 181602=DAOM 197198]